MSAPSPDPRGSVPEGPADASPREALALWLLTWGALAAGLVLLLLGLPRAGTPGTDETLHAFAGLRMVEHLKALDAGAFWRELHRPDYYTPIGRLGLGLGFLFGDGFAAPRAATCVAWILSIALTVPLARRIAPRSPGHAGLWAALFLLTSWLGVSYSRGTYLEAWSALATVVCVHLYLRAREGGTALGALACGIGLGMALLVKYTYGLFIVGAVGLSGLWDLWRRPPGVRPGKLAAWVAAGMLGTLAWWFVLPLPLGLETGAAHRERFVTYLKKAADLSSPGPEFVVVAWALEACLSLAICALQLVAIGWGFSRWRDPAARLCATLAFVGPLGFVVYPFRIDRFLLPTLFGACALSGALVAAWIGRTPPRWRAPVAIGLALLLFGTRGLGSAAVLQRVYPAVQDEAAAANAKRWARPYAHRLAPASGPEGTQAVLDAAARHLDPARRFAWIGGTGTELPPILLDWKLFQESGDRTPIFRDRPEVEWFWSEPPWDEAAFRAWASLYPQIGVLEPPDPRNRPREFEVRYARWMAAHPGFEVLARETVEIVVPGRKPEALAHEVVIYRRRE